MEGSPNEFLGLQLFSGVKAIFKECYGYGLLVLFQAFA